MVALAAVTMEVRAAAVRAAVTMEVRAAAVRAELCRYMWEM